MKDLILRIELTGGIIKFTHLSTLLDYIPNADEKKLFINKLKTTGINHFFGQRVTIFKETNRY